MVNFIILWKWKRQEYKSKPPWSQITINKGTLSRTNSKYQVLKVYGKHTQVAIWLSNDL